MPNEPPPPLVLDREEPRINYIMSSNPENNSNTGFTVITVVFLVIIWCFYPVNFDRSVIKCASLTQEGSGPLQFNIPFIT